MKKWLMFTGFSSIVVLVSLGCGTSNQLAAGIIDDARAKITSAKAADALNLANQEMADAEQWLSQAETALNAGKEKDAYRLGKRSYLKARVAEAVAAASRMEEQAHKVEQELELKGQAVEAAARELKHAESELEQLKSTPEP